eukprot:2784688-Prorocentrum_lima.AAC.1
MVPAPMDAGVLPRSEMTRPARSIRVCVRVVFKTLGGRGGAGTPYRHLHLEDGSTEAPRRCT